MAVMLERWNDDKMDALDGKVGGSRSVLRGRMRRSTGWRRMSVKLDTKLDDHRKETKAGFERMDEKFERMDEKFERMDLKFERMDEKFERMDLKFERIQRTLFLASVTVIAVLIAALTSHP